MSKEQLLKIHSTAMEGGGTNGILNESMLELAVDAPGAELYGVELHESLLKKAAAMMHEVIKLHPFIDGNKRTGLIAADTFLRVNGYELRAPAPASVEAALKTAECSMDIPKITDWINTFAKRRVPE